MVVEQAEQREKKRRKEHLPIPPYKPDGINDNPLCPSYTKLYQCGGFEWVILSQFPSYNRSYTTIPIRLILSYKLRCKPCDLTNRLIIPSLLSRLSIT